MKAEQVRSKHKTLRQRYAKEPAAAVYTYRVRATAGDPDPRYAEAVTVGHGGARWKVSINERIAGPGDMPTPGDLLLASLAASKALSVRLLAATLRIELSSLEVEVEGDIDHRGLMLMPGAPRAGFRAVRCLVRLGLPPGTPPEVRVKLTYGVEASCAVSDTIKNPTPLETHYEVV